jgi:hypothetical protein
VVKTRRRKNYKSTSLGLSWYGTVFENYVEKELGKSHAIKNLCITCLNVCFTKRNFTKLLPNDQANELKSNVGRQVCINTKTSSVLEEHISMKRIFFWGFVNLNAVKY